MKTYCICLSATPIFSTCSQSKTCLIRTQKEDLFCKRNNLNLYTLHSIYCKTIFFSIQKVSCLILLKIGPSFSCPKHACFEQRTWDLVTPREYFDSSNGLSDSVVTVLEPTGCVRPLCPSPGIDIR